MVTPAAKREAVADGLDARDSRVHNYPPHWNGAPSQELLVIRRNHHCDRTRLRRCGSGRSQRVSTSRRTTTRQSFSRSSYLPLSYVISVLRLYAFNSNNIVLCVLRADFARRLIFRRVAKQATAPCYPIE